MFVAPAATFIETFELYGSADFGVKTRTVSRSAQRIDPATALPPTETENARAVLRRSIALGEADRDRGVAGDVRALGERAEADDGRGLDGPDGERDVSSGRPSASRTPETMSR